MEAYAAAKARVYARASTAIVNRDEPALARLVPRDTPTITFGFGAPSAGHFGLVRDSRGEWLAFGGEALLPVGALGTAGRHNVANALAALAICRAAGAAPAACLAGLRAFRGLPHRMQIVEVTAGVTWIDDSKATNVAAAVTSIRGVERAAGADRRRRRQGPAVRRARGRAPRPRRRWRSCSAGTGRQIARELAGACAVELVDTLPQAVALARGSVRGRGTPCCSRPRAAASTCSRTTRIAAGSSPNRCGGVRDEHPRRQRAQLCRSGFRARVRSPARPRDRRAARHRARHGGIRLHVAGGARLRRPTLFLLASARRHCNRSRRRLGDAEDADCSLGARRSRAGARGYRAAARSCWCPASGTPSTAARAG